ncbi:MAG TPA: universal stress protein [Propionibacteriaceae bacterium]|nr:universal stress protein [Propionibacteriaceae bacterium]
MNIVAGYIPTREGVAAVDFAIEQIKASGGTLTVVNTGKGGDYSDPVFATPQDVDALDAQLSAAGIQHEILQPTDGVPAAASILEAAERLNADLIVIGIRRRSAVGKLITGSTAQAVLLGADCPVVGVKAKR